MDAAGRLSRLRVEFPFFFLGVAAIPTSLQIIGTGVLRRAGRRIKVQSCTHDLQGNWST